MNEPPPSTCSRPGQNQPRARQSVAAPSAIAAVIGSPVFVARGAIVHATSPGTPCSRASRRCPRSRRRRGSRPATRRSRSGPRATSRRRPTTRPSSSVSSPVTGRLVRISPPSRMKIVRQPGDQGLAAAERVAPTLTGPVALDRRPHQLGHLGRQVGALDVRRLDRAAERDPAGRVVVLRERQPLEVEVRVRLEGRDQLGGVGEERLDLLLVGVLEDRAEVLAGTLGRVGDPGPLLDLGARQPAGAAGVRRGAAEVRVFSTTQGRAARPWPPARRRSWRRRRIRPRPRRTAAPSPRDRRN